MEKNKHHLKQAVSPVKATESGGAYSPPGSKSKLVQAIKFCLIIFLFTSSMKISAGISGNTVVCANSSAIYTYPFTAGYTYSWNVTGAPQSAASGNSLTVTWGSAGGGLVSLIVKDVFGVVVFSGSLPVTIKPLPVPQIVPLNANGCSYAPPPRPKEGNTVTPTQGDNCFIVCDSSLFTYQASLPTGSHSYNWRVIPATAAINQVVTGLGQIQIKWGAASPSQITLRLLETDLTTGCSDSVDICLKIIARPNALFGTFPAAVSNTVHICYNSTVSYTDMSTTDPNSTIANWYWTFGDGTTSTLQNPAHTFTASGTYITKLVVENQCHCRDSMMVTVIVDALPGPDITCISAVCFNASDTYCTSFSCSPYTWSVGNGTIVSGAGTSCIKVNWGTSGPGSITLQGASCTGACTYPTTVLVPVLPTSATISGPNPACLNMPSIYSVPIVPSTTYFWTVIGTGTIVSGQGTNVITVYWGATGPQQLKVSYTNVFLGCSGSSLFNLTVGQKHVITGSNVLCQGTSGTYNSNASASSWTITNAAGAIVYTNPSAASITFGFGAPGAYIVYAKDLTGTLCSSPAAFQVQVVARPPVVTAAINTTICPGQTYLYTGVPTSVNYYLKWTIVGGMPNLTTGNSISVTWNTTGPWSITLTQVDVLPPSCESAGTVYNMVTAPPPTPVIVGPTTSCYNQTAVYSTPSSGDTYNWSISPTTLGSILPGTGPNNITVQFNNGTTAAVVTLDLQITSCGSSATKVYTINLSPGPTPTITVPTNICQGQPATFGASISGSNYAWSFGDGGSVSGPGFSSAVHTYTAVLPYVVSVTVTAPGGCTGSTSTSTIINVKPTPVANITSPNNLRQCINGAPFSYTLFASAQTIAGTPTYTWLPVASPNNSVVISQAGVFTMMVGINGCVATNTILVDTSCVVTPPCTYLYPGTHQAYFTAPINCTQVNFNPTIIGTGGTVLLWQFNDPNYSTSTLTNPSFTYPASGYYPVILRAGWPSTAGGYCFKDTSILVTLPIFADFKYNFNCSGTGLTTTFIDQTNYLAAIGVGTRNWVVTPGPYTSGATNPTFPLPPGTYTAQLTSVSGTVTCVATKTLIVPQRPIASFVVPSSICEGNPLTFTNTSTPTAGVSSYVWDFGDFSGLMTQNPNPNGVRTYVYALPAIKNTKLNITDVYGCTSSYGPVNVLINQNLFTPTNVAVTPSVGTICQGDSLQICSVTAGSPNPNTPYTYQWTNTQTTQCIYAKQVGTYGVVVTDIFGCHSVQKSASLNVIIVPTPLVSGNLSYCIGDPVLMSIDKGIGYKYQWIYNYLGSNTTTPCTSPLFPAPSPPCSPMSPSISPTYTGNITLQGWITETTSGLGCRAFGPPVTIVIHPLPATPTVATSQCVSSSPINLSATIPSGAISTIWNTGAQGTVISVNSPGKYWASVLDVYGCKSIADTANIWPKPDFNPLIFGCYTICDTGTTTVPVPPGYATYTWLKIGYGTILGPSTSPINLVFSNPSTIPGGNAGVYRLILKTVNGCVDTSKTITIDVKPCNTCSLSVTGTTINCVNGLYSFTMSVNYPGLVAGNYTLASSTGTISSLMPAGGVLNPGVNIITGNFVAGTGQTQFCYTFTVASTDSSIPPCTWSNCKALPPCGAPPCKLQMTLTLNCETRTSNGYPIYYYILNFFYPGTSSGTINISSAQGIVGNSTATVNPGSNTFTGTFTDTPVFDGTGCFDIYIYDPIAGWCYQQICAPTQEKAPCFTVTAQCNIKITVKSVTCLTVNALGQPVYQMQLAMNTGAGNQSSFYIMSGQGIVGPSSPTLIQVPSIVFTNTFVQTLPLVGGQLCFTLVATNTLTGKQCIEQFCFTPPDCGSSPARLMNPNSNNSNISLFPNPTGDYTIAEYNIERTVVETDPKVSISSISVIDLEGRLVLDVPLTDTKGSVKINTSSLIPGLYFLRAMNNGNVVLVKKLIIQR